MSLSSLNQRELENSRVEAFSHDLCNYVFRRLGIILDSAIVPTQADGLFTESIGNAVLYNQVLIRNCLYFYFNFHFNRIVADLESITYEFCSRIYAFSTDTLCQKFFRISAFIMELFIYCKESHITEAELGKTPLLWKTIFDLVIKSDFYRQENPWGQVSVQSLYYCEQLSRPFEPVIEALKNVDIFSQIPRNIEGVPTVLARVSIELREVLTTSYEDTDLEYIRTVPMPLFHRRIELNNDEYVRSSASPLPKRFKKVHEVYDW